MSNALNSLLPPAALLDPRLAEKVVDGDTWLKAANLIDDKSERTRTTLLSITSLLELVHVTTVSLEVARDRSDSPDSRSTVESVEAITKVRLAEVHRQNAQILETLREYVRTQNSGTVPPTMNDIVESTDRFVHGIDAQLLTDVASWLGMGDVAERVKRAHAGIASFVQRHRNSKLAERRLRVLGQLYCDGKLGVEAIASILELSVPDTVALLEQNGYSRPLEHIALTEEQRATAFARLRDDRLARAGRPRGDRAAIVQDVIASQRIEGIDAREHFRSELGAPVCTTTTSTAT